MYPGAWEGHVEGAWNNQLKSGEAQTGFKENNVNGNSQASKYAPGEGCAVRSWGKVIQGVAAPHCYSFCMSGSGGAVTDRCGDQRWDPRKLHEDVSGKVLIWVSGFGFSP